MLTAILIVAAFVVCALSASWVMWWTTRRSAFWAMAAGALFALAVAACALVIAWLLTRAVYGG